MYDYEKAKALTKSIKEQLGYSCAMAKSNEGDDHMIIIIDDLKEEFPNMFFNIYFDQDEYYVIASQLVKVDIDNDNTYYQALQEINYQNSGNDYWRWFIDEDGYLSAIYSPQESFTQDEDFYCGLIENLVTEIYEFLEL